MSFSEFIRSLSQEQLADYAERCGTSPAYIKIHLLHARKEPKKSLREALCRESNGSVSLHEILRHFNMIDAV